MELEYFKDIPEWTNYQITSKGRIYNKILKKFRKLSIDKRNYIHVDLWSNTQSKTYSVHRLVADAFCYGKTYAKNTVNHKDANPSNNNYSNLEWCTQKDNIDHAKQLGLCSINEDAGTAILSNSDVLEIAKLLEDPTILMSEIGEYYGVVRGAIFNIYSRRTWGNITKDFLFANRPSSIKLNIIKVKEIIQLLNTHKNKELGEIYGVNRKTISDIRLNKTWKSIPREKRKLLCASK